MYCEFANRAGDESIGRCFAIAMPQLSGLDRQHHHRLDVSVAATGSGRCGERSSQRRKQKTRTMREHNEMRNSLFQNPIVPQEHREMIVDHIVYVHTSVLQYTVDFATKLKRRNYVTPRHFLDFINTYLKSLTEKKNFINSHRARLSGGIAALFSYKLFLFYYFSIYFFLIICSSKFNNILSLFEV